MILRALRPSRETARSGGERAALWPVSAEALMLGAAAVVALAGPVAWALGADDRPWTAALLGALLLAYAGACRLLGAGAVSLRLPFAGAFALLWAGVAVSLIERTDLNAASALVAMGALAVIAADVAARARGPERILAGAAVALGGTAALALGAWLTGFRELVPFTPDSQGRLSWPFTHPNHLGTICAILLPLAIIAAVRASGRATRLAAGLAVALGLAALALSASRTAWIAAAAGVAIVAAYGPARRAIVIGAAATLALASPVILERAGDADLGLGNTRLPIWDDALTAFAEHPLTGVGINGFADHARPIVELPGAPIPHHAHELYLGRAAELGVLGLAGIVALLALAFLSAHRAARGPAGGRRLLAIGTAASLAVVAVVGLFDDPLHRYAQVLVWALIGMAAAAEARRIPTLRAAHHGGGTRRTGNPV